MRILPGQSQILFRVLIQCFPWELERLQRELQHGHLQASKRVSDIYISLFYEKLTLISSEKNPPKIQPFHLLRQLKYLHVWYQGTSVLMTILG